MKNHSQKAFLALAILCAMLLSLAPVHAEGATLKFSGKTTCVVGETVTLSIVVANAPALSSVQFDVGFDSSKVQFAGGTIGGTTAGSGDGDNPGMQLPNTNTVRALSANRQITSATIATLRFKAIAATDQVTFSLKGIVLGTIDGPVDATPLGSLTIAIAEPAPLSKNADLKSLQIAPGVLTPAFTSDNTIYTAMVPPSTANLTVSAAAADSKATCEVTGHKNLQPGDSNTVRIVVTAESGATKTYTIKVTRAAVTPTPAPSPTPAPTPAPALAIKVNGRNMTVVPLAAGKTPPAGFSEASISLQDHMVPAFVSQSGGMTLLHLAENGGAGAFYVYDAATGAFALFRSISVPARQYVLLPVDGVTAPAGFKPATVNVASQQISGFLAEKPGVDGSQATLIYLMDASGIKALYVWNARTEEPVRFVAAGAQPTAAPTPSPSPAVTPAGAGRTNDGSGNAGGPGGLLPYILAIAGLASLSVILGAVLVYKQFSSRNAKPYYTPRVQPPPIRRVD